MILVLSKTDDLTTDLVCEWLVYLNKKFTRINLDIESIVEFNFELSKDIQLKINLSSYRELCLTNITSVWYRRGEFYFEKPGRYENEFAKSVDKILEKELNICTKFIYKCLQIIPKLKIGSILAEMENNKLEQLYFASHVGLIIPKTYVKSKQQKNLDLNESTLITKPIFNSFEISNGSYFFKRSIEIFDDSLNANLGENTFPFLLQEKLNKKFEIRAFILDKTFYSMAIFSQNNEKTSLDFRNYDDNKPNRVVRFKLPDEIETKLLKLLTILSMDSGSVDIVYTDKDEFVFLEVNHIGQFGWLSYYCNYHLHKKMSELL